MVDDLRHHPSWKALFQISTTPGTPPSQKAQKIRQIAAGRSHTCVLFESGQVKCWGSNVRGQTVVPDELGPAVSIAAGPEATCAIVESGIVRCWGEAGTRPFGNRQVVSLAMGRDEICVTLKRGTLICHGQRKSRPIEDEATDWILVGSVNWANPFNSDAAVLIGAKEDVTCVILASGRIKCWGGRFDSRDTELPSVGSVKKLFVGVKNLCVLLKSGEARCFSGPKDKWVTNMRSAASIAVGNSHVCYLLKSGDLKCEGSDDKNQLKVPEHLEGVKLIAAGGDHTCAALKSGGVWCWGANDAGQSTVPAEVQDLLGGVVIPGRYTLGGLEEALTYLSDVVYTHKREFLLEASKLISRLPYFSVAGGKNPSQKNTEDLLGRLFVMNALEPFVLGVDSEIFEQRVHSLFRSSLERLNREYGVSSLAKFSWHDGVRTAALGMMRISLMSSRAFLTHTSDAQLLESTIQEIGYAQASGLKRRTDRDRFLEALRNLEPLSARLSEQRATQSYGLILVAVSQYVRGVL